MTPRFAHLLVLALSLGGCSSLSSFNDYVFDLDAGSAGDASTDAESDANTDLADGSMDGALADAPSDAAPDSGDGGPPPPLPDVFFPWNGYYTGSPHASSGLGVDPLRPRLRWNSEADHFQVQMGPDEMLGTETLDLDETTEDTNFRPAERLTVSLETPVGERLYWHVRACNDMNICSAWTETRYINVGRQPSDFNGDGFADLAVGIPQYESVTTDERHGAVRIVFGASPLLNEQRVENPNPQTNGLFGQAVAALDVDGDGFGDLLVGAPGEGEGKAYLFAGGESGLAPIPTVLTAARSTADFGARVASAGDVDGDGFDDLVVGAPFEREGGVESGAAYLYRGARTLGPPTRLTPSASRDNMGARFGESIAGIGDTDGDGLVELAIGAPDRDTNAGTVFIYSGTRAESFPAPVEFDPPVGSDSLGGSVAGGDINGDGYSDLAVGAPVARHPGKAFIYFGGPGRLMTTAIPLDQAGGTSDLFGRAIAVVDLDADGFGEVVVGAYLAGTNNQGLIDVFVGSRAFVGGVADARQIHPDGTAGGTFGIAVADAGDVNGDGYNNLIVGASGHTMSVPGKVFLFERPHGVLNIVYSVRSMDPRAWFGAAVARLWHLSNWTII